MKNLPIWDMRQHYFAFSFSISGKIKVVILMNNIYMLCDKNNIESSLM